MINAINLYLPVNPKTLPTAQQKGVTRDGRVYTKAKVVAAKARLCQEIKVAFWGLSNAARREGKYPYTQEEKEREAWTLTVTFCYNLTSGRRGHWKATRPDVDNLAKLVIDALQDTRLFFDDDAQIACLYLTKRHAEHGERAHIFVELRPMGGLAR